MESSSRTRYIVLHLEESSVIRLSQVVSNSKNSPPQHCILCPGRLDAGLLNGHIRADYLIADGTA